VLLRWGEHFSSLVVGNLSVESCRISSATSAISTRGQDYGMLIFDRENWPKHRPWAIVSLLVLLAAIGWYLEYGFRGNSDQWRWPSGASPPGLSYGLLGGAIIVFEMLLWPRKYLWRGLRLGRTKAWMSAHLWLGVLLLPLLCLHGGFHFALGRSTLAAVLMWLLILVFLSGLFGATMQHILPRLLLNHAPAETIYDQIGHMLNLYRHEAEQLVRAICGPDEMSPSSLATLHGGEASSPYLVSETVRKAGKIQGRVLGTTINVARISGSEALRSFHLKYVDPYLCARSGRGLPLGVAIKAAMLFQEVKVGLSPEAHVVVDRMEELCSRRRQFDFQRRLHRWLHIWIAIHLSASVALLVLMLVHSYLALKYV
jgi:hypothetical protein